MAGWWCDGTHTSNQILIILSRKKTWLNSACLGVRDFDAKSSITPQEGRSGNAVCGYSEILCNTRASYSCYVKMLKMKTRPAKETSFFFISVGPKLICLKAEGLQAAGNRIKRDKETNAWSWQLFGTGMKLGRCIKQPLRPEKKREAQ